eukprot:364768-Chlamydomonas_euryale.AAC.2
MSVTNNGVVGKSPPRTRAAQAWAHGVPPAQPALVTHTSCRWPFRRPAPPPPPRPSPCGHAVTRPASASVRELFDGASEGAARARRICPPARPAPAALSPYLGCPARAAGGGGPALWAQPFGGAQEGHCERQPPARGGRAAVVAAAASDASPRVG